MGSESQEAKAQLRAAWDDMIQSLQDARDAIDQAPLMPPPATERNLAEGYRYLMGCASIPMQDGGVQAQAIMQRLRERHLCTEHLRAEPRTPLPAMDLPGNVIAEMPPLLKAYMRLGAKVCGEPCWDRDFQVADVFILLKRDELCPRYARHFKAAV